MMRKSTRRELQDRAAPGLGTAATCRFDPALHTERHFGDRVHSNQSSAPRDHAAGSERLLTRSLQGTESLSELFSFRLDLLADKYVKIPFEKILGQSVTIEIAHPTGTTRTINGIVSRFSQGERDDVFASYEAEVVPRVWLLTRRIDSRIFQQLSVPEILAKVLTAFNYSPELSGTYPPRHYCVQYQESDFAFISRLMEEEGISSFFRHQNDSHELVLSDAATNLPPIADPSNVIYEQVRGAVKDSMRITAWKKSQQICSNRYTLWDRLLRAAGQKSRCRRKCPDHVAGWQGDAQSARYGSEVGSLSLPWRIRQAFRWRRARRRRPLRRSGEYLHQQQAHGQSTNAGWPERGDYHLRREQLRQLHSRWQVYARATF